MIHEELPGAKHVAWLTLIALAVPTLYGLALDPEEWALAIFPSMTAAMQDWLTSLEAMATLMLGAWLGHRQRHWFGFSQSASLLAASILVGQAFWPFVDARAYVDQVFDTYRSFEQIYLGFWLDQFPSVLEGALIGAGAGLAWLGLEALDRLLAVDTMNKQGG